MDAVTYPQEVVARFIMENMIPLRLPFDAEPYASEFNIKWTPTLITLCPDRVEHHRTLGFLPAEELIPSLLLGMGKGYFDRDQHQEALSKLEAVVSGYPGSDSAAEAVYYAGVSRFKIHHDPKPLKEAYERLQAEYPSSDWVKRAYPYRLL